MAKYKGATCIYFEDKEAYTWLPHGEAQELIDSGEAVEYDPFNKPTMDSLKSEIIEYLDKQGIDYNKSDRKAELLELI